MKKFLAVILICAAVYGLISLSSCDPGTVQRNAAPGSSIYDLALGGLNAQSTARAADQLANQFYAAQTAQVEEIARQAAATQVVRTEIAAQATAEANSTATAQAWALIGWTATADAAESTAEAAQTAQAGEATRTAVAQDAHSTAVAAEYLAATLRQAQRRNEATNTVLAWAPYAAAGLLALSMLILGALGAIKYWRSPVVIQRDARGDMPALVGNHGQVLDLDRVIGGVVQLLPSGATAPMLASPEAQERHTARDQAVDLATRGLPGQQIPTQRANRAASPGPLPGTPPNYRIYLEPEQPPQLLQDPQLLAALDGQWKEIK